MEVMSIMAARTDRTLRTTADTVVAQANALVDAPLPQPARLRMVTLADDFLEALARPTNARNQSWASLLSHRQAGAHQLDMLDRETAAGTAAPLVAKLADARWADLAGELHGPLPVSITNHFGNSHVTDYLRATLLELCVLADQAGALQPAALRMAVRSLTQALGERFPGQTIEVRVPPAAAVQVGAFGEGPTHTRGTPPNVVETDELTWLRIATGRLPLDEALDQALATASGSHHEALERMLPVIDLRHLA